MKVLQDGRDFYFTHNDIEIRITIDCVNNDNDMTGAATAREVFVSLMLPTFGYIDWETP